MEGPTGTGGTSANDDALGGEAFGQIGSPDVLQ
jgi:hypothetical protein